MGTPRGWGRRAIMVMVRRYWLPYHAYASCATMSTPVTTMAPSVTGDRLDGSKTAVDAMVVTS